MTGFERLHPSLQHHVVNSLGWRSLRPLQEQAIDPVLDGRNCLLLAPTAGGKTEAAILPLLSRMLAADWKGLGVLYVCPIRALLNNLEERLSYYAGLVGRRCGLWHGDVGQAQKAAILNEPPDILLTTPESLEAILISRRTDKAFFFGCLQAVVIDEIHAFAGDDRGWHLLAVLERVGQLAGRTPQRIGLSATVGNPEELLHWMAGDGVVVNPPAPGNKEAEVTIDYVGNLANAAKVLKLIHVGEKRLVFCDSRARAEELASFLRAEGVSTFVSHSSLSVEARRDAERAFREARDCVIVATSTLELGIDVGDLDRVIQIDAPSTVASFLQRLGRSGRRAGTVRNCLFLATSPGALLHAAALVSLWRSGYVEPIIPPPLPYHLFAQQTLALVLQSSPVSRATVRQQLAGLVTAAGLDVEACDAVMGHMLAVGVLAEDEGILSIGAEGERLYGAKHYITLLSIFDSPPLFTVYWGPKEIGAVHPISFRRDGPTILSLGGRPWQVGHIDWNHQVAHVSPADELGRSRWLGDSRPLSYRLCRAIRDILLGTEERQDGWSNRAARQIAETRESSNQVAPDALVVEVDQERERITWWTFAGLFANGELASAWSTVRFDNFGVIADGAGVGDVMNEIRNAALRPASADDQRPKFHECLPAEVLNRMTAARRSDRAAVAKTLQEPLLYRHAR